uniref:Uncharacterized LOC100179289 n=1 Tax=Ciona intestinalis TaxID=7719 RepID=A0A1W2WMN3_CIOIN|nr:uncharacterized protein LOC100179289 [Ciona intestinalis]|eukprot:XP_026690703.1 uncharacterized protein LOC100179289 [Ciona intestinalis]
MGAYAVIGRFIHIAVWVILCKTAGGTSLIEKIREIENRFETNSSSIKISEGSGSGSTTPNILTHDLTTVGSVRGPGEEEEIKTEEEAWKTVVVGSSLALFFIFLALLAKIKKVVAFCKTFAEEKTDDEIEDEGYVEDISQGDVAVTYDLWSSQSRVRTISGVIDVIIDGSSRHQRPCDVRTVKAYRNSFRNFKKSHPTKGDDLPSYYDVTKGRRGGETPPDYNEVTAGCSRT